jgi:hypothetical protein
MFLSQTSPTPLKATAKKSSSCTSHFVAFSRVAGDNKKFFGEQFPPKKTFLWLINSSSWMKMKKDNSMLNRYCLLYRLPSEGGTIVSEVMELLFENGNAIVDSWDQGMPEGSAMKGTLSAQNLSESSAPAPLFDGNDPNAVFHLLEMITGGRLY